MPEDYMGTTGLSAPELPGKPKGVRRSTGSPLSPGTQALSGFEEAANFARVSGEDKNGVYKPLDRPGRIATRIATPDAPAGFGLGEKGVLK